MTQTSVRSSPTLDLIEWSFGDTATIRLSVGPDEPVQLLGLGQSTVLLDPQTERIPLVEISLDREGRTGRSPNAQNRQYVASARLRLVDQREWEDAGVRLLEIRQADPKTRVEVATQFEHRPGADAVRVVNRVTNAGPEPVALHYISTVNLGGFTDAAIGEEPERLQLSWVRNAWFAEFRWQTQTLEQAGIVDIGPLGGEEGTVDIGGANNSSLGRVEVAGIGSWSTGDFLPVGAVTDTATGRAWTWQIEHNGAWQWQALDRARQLYVSLSGPTEDRHGWSQTLATGETFTTVPATLAVSADGLEGALAELTRYRRLIRRPNADNTECPVIFNDYMNALNGDPTTGKLLPLIDAAAAAGSEYFVIDAGWYADDPGWWDSVGEWQPSARRFPGGLGEVIEAIAAHQMVPGLWLEPEVIGVRSPVLDRLPTEALFARDGVPLAENGRYQLDLRHPAARAHLDETIDRLIADFGIGYFKFDYNINIGTGTDLANAGQGAGEKIAPGAGLLGHNRAYSDWLDGLFVRHPELVIENCSSGGMRVDYAQLSRLSLQSTSDQTDPVRYVPISAAAPACVAPEQSAVWAYPQPDWSVDVNELTMINALLGRVHLSGRLDRLDAAGRQQIGDGISVYKAIRHRIPDAVGTWPLGLPGWYDPWCAVGLRDGEGILLQVWRRGGGSEITLPLPILRGSAVQARVLYPSAGGAELSWSDEDATLTVRLPRSPSAVLIELGRSTPTTDRPRSTSADSPDQSGR